MVTDAQLKALGLDTRGAVNLFRAQGWNTLDDVRGVDFNSPDVFPKHTYRRTKEKFIKFVEGVLADRAVAIAAYDAQTQARKYWQSQYRRRLSDSADFTVRLRFRLPDLTCDALTAEDAEKFIVGVLLHYLAKHPDPRYRRARISATQFERSYGEEDNGSAL